MIHKFATKSPGFSMIELVIVITIIGIITTIAVPKFADAGSGRRLSAAKKTLLSDIETVKLRARATSKVHVIKFYPEENRYIVFEGEDIARDAIVLIRDFDDNPYNVEIKRSSLGTDSYAVITLYGEVSPSFTAGILDNGIEIAVEVGGIADVGLTAADSMTPSEVKSADPVDVLADAGGG